MSLTLAPLKVVFPELLKLHVDRVIRLGVGGMPVDAEAKADARAKLTAGPTAAPTAVGVKRFRDE